MEKEKENEKKTERGKETYCGKWCGNAVCSKFGGTIGDK